MRTTLTLEPDVALKLKRKMTEQKLTLKDAVNQALTSWLSGQGSALEGSVQGDSTWDSGGLMMPGIDFLTRLANTQTGLEDEERMRKLGQ